MSFDWTDYLDLARHLARSGSIHSGGEAEMRAAISRAYYAAFCKSRNYLRDIDHDPFSSGPNVHRDVQDKFSSSRDHRRRSIGQDLSRLRRLRNIADYDDRCINLSKNTAFALGMAESIISDLKNL
jgi:hypothetical protein